MSQSIRGRIWLWRFSVFTGLATLALVCLGGLVTSHGVGMAVPDWPNTYGYNLFLFPVSAWVGGIFYEHTHRLAGATVGLLTTVLAIWTWRVDRRPAMRWFVVGLWLGVVLQGVLGGLRVVLLKDQIGIIHAALAQVFLAGIWCLALFHSPGWRREDWAGRTAPASRRLLRAATTVSAAIFVQLLLGASMRHQHAGLAVPDFPLAYGELWPATDLDSVANYNRARLESQAVNPITAGQIHLHMAHRLTAVVVLVLAARCWWMARQESGPRGRARRLASALFALVLCQVGLGAATVLSNKAADVATAHVVVGAASFVISVVLVIVVRRLASLTVAVPEGEPHFGRAVPAPILPAHS